MSGWREDAICVAYPKSLFFPPPNGDYRAARLICDRCPVATACLDEAMRLEQNGRRHGMFGGLTPEERDDLSSGTTRPRGHRSVDPIYVRTLVDEIAAEQGHRRGARKRAAELLGVHPNTIYNALGAA